MNEYLQANIKQIRTTLGWRYSFTHIPSLVRNLANEGAFGYLDPTRPTPGASTLKQVDGTMLNGFVSHGTMPDACIGCFVQGWKEFPVDDAGLGKWRMIYVELDLGHPEQSLELIKQFVNYLYKVRQSIPAVPVVLNEPPIELRTLPVEIEEETVPQPSSDEEEETSPLQVAEEEIRFQLSDRKEDVTRFSLASPRVDDRYQLDDRICESIKRRDVEKPRYSADDDFEIKAKELEKELRDKFAHLNNPGMVQAVLRRLLNEQVVCRPSRLVVTKQGRLLLPDFQNREICCGALPKALYMLFLELPDGILLKDMGKHRERLVSIYVRLSNRESGPTIVDTVNRLLDPGDNSVNVNITRINKAFASNMPELLASQYCITGTAGTTKKITLDRRLVVWE